MGQQVNDDDVPACLNTGEFEDLAQIYRALGHPVRLAILSGLRRVEVACCGEIVNRLPLAQSTVSQHLQVLKDARLVVCESSGRSCQYSLNVARLDKAAEDSASYLSRVRSGPESDVPEQVPSSEGAPGCGEGKETAFDR